MIPVALLMLSSCGGGGGGSSGGSVNPGTDAPSVWNLQFSPARAPIDDGSATLYGSFQFSDTKANITSAIATVLDASGGKVESSWRSIPDLSGQAQGTASFVLTISTTGLGNYRLQITLTDAIGDRSNVIEEVFKIIENPWTAKAVMPTPRAGLAAASANGKLYAVGGYVDSDLPISNLEEYDPQADTWAEKAAMPTARSHLAMVNIGDKLYAVGGVASGSPIKAVEMYDPAADSWDTKTPMAIARSGLGVVELNGMLYAIGGRDDSTPEDLATVEQYLPATDTWTTVAPMTTPRYAPAVGVANGKIYVTGGTNGDDYNSSIEEYDPDTNTWTTKTAVMPSEVVGLTGAAVNGMFYYMGGFFKG